MKKTAGWIIFVLAVVAVIGLILSWDGPGGNKTFRELSSNYYCGGCNNDVGVEIKVNTAVKRVFLGHWEYNYTFSTTRGPNIITVNVGSANCKEFSLGYRVTSGSGALALDGCSVTFQLSKEFTFSTSANEGPKEADISMKITTIEGKDPRSGLIALYVPAN